MNKGLLETHNDGQLAIGTTLHHLRGAGRGIPLRTVSAAAWPLATSVMGSTPLPSTHAAPNVFVMAAPAWRAHANMRLPVLGGRSFEPTGGRLRWRDREGILATIFHAGAIPLAFASSWISGLIYIFLASIWWLPDRRIEDRLNHCP